MPWWASLLVAIAFAAAALIVVAWSAYMMRPRRRLHARSGPEYDAIVESPSSRCAAESGLQQRLKRRQHLDVRALDATARVRYEEQWRVVQADFVSTPEGALGKGQSLVRALVRARGHPCEGFDQRVVDLSVDHPKIAQNCRAASTTAERSARREATTEELRQALQRHRALFDDLLNRDAPAAVTPS
jgi:hypothetical protein